MTDASQAISWFDILLSLGVAASAPLALRFHWLDSKVSRRWARWLLVALLWALLLPTEGLAVCMLYDGLRPVLLGSGVVEPLDMLRQAWFSTLAVAFFFLMCALALAFLLGSHTQWRWWYDSKDLRTPFLLRDQIPPELTYRRRRKKEPPSA
jgi:hypothetical protein